MEGKASRVIRDGTNLDWQDILFMLEAKEAPKTSQEQVGRGHREVELYGSSDQQVVQGYRQGWGQTLIFG